MRFLTDAMMLAWFLLAFIAGGLLYRSILLAPEVPTRVAAGAHVFSTPAAPESVPSGLGRHYDVEPGR